MKIPDDQDIDTAKNAVSMRGFHAGPPFYFYCEKCKKGFAVGYHEQTFLGIKLPVQPVEPTKPKCPHCKSSRYVHKDFKIIK